jgi:hypothetical protein
MSEQWKMPAGKGVSMCSRPARPAVILLVLAGSPWLPAADLPFVRYTLTGEKAFDRLGGSLAAMGDIDGDGVPDFAAGATEHAAAGLTGKVVLFSGKEGAVIRTLRSKESRSFFGHRVANAGDVDRDGMDDVLASNAFLVEILSSRTGERLGRVDDQSFTSASMFLRSAGDVNGDVVPDFLIGNAEPRDSEYGSIRMYSGKTSELLWAKDSLQAGDYFGVVVVSTDDMNGDGIADFGTKRNTLPAGQGYGIVECRSGKDGSLISDLSLGVSGDRFGGDMDLLSDADGDGSRELAITAYGYPLHGYPDAGLVSLYDLHSETNLWTRSGLNFNRTAFGDYLPGDHFGSLCSRAGDADGDGFVDLLVLSPRYGFAGNDTPWVYLLSGRSGDVLSVYDRDREGTLFGHVLSELGDIDGDSRSDFLIGAPDWTLDEGLEPVYALGRIYVLSYLPGQRPFVRGDADLDLDIDLSDVISIFEHLFAGKRQPCEEAMDINADGRLNDTDALRLAWHLFVSGHSPWPPYPDCGRFESFGERLSCARSACE